MANNYIDGCLFGIVQRDSEKKPQLKINDFTIPLYSPSRAAMTHFKLTKCRANLSYSKKLPCFQ